MNLKIVNAVNFANDEKNVSTYEKLCSRSSDPKEKEEARKFRRKALIKLHPDKNSKCALLNGNAN